MDHEFTVDATAKIDEASKVARAQDRDPEAFEELLLAYQDKLFRLALRMLNDRGQAEDVVQDVLLAGWRQLPLLRDVNTFGGWIYKLATNRCLDILRQRSTHPEDLTDPQDISSVGDVAWAGNSQESDPVETTERQFRAQGLTEALGTLSPEQRACWLLREIHERSYAEIGAILNLPTTAVRGRLARARHEIAERMSPWR
jgi:RNA polymerase sigma-70 factor (ECF subfamily)